MLSITKSAFLIDEKYFNRNKRENKQTGYSKKTGQGLQQPPVHAIIKGMCAFPPKRMRENKTRRAADIAQAGTEKEATAYERAENRDS
jgi:hypothetical protein